jgi:hypothetical protein
MYTTCNCDAPVAVRPVFSEFPSIGPTAPLSNEPTIRKTGRASFACGMNPQMSQIDADSEKRDEQRFSVIGAAMAVEGVAAKLWHSTTEYKRLVFHLRSSASSADFSL